MIYKKLFRFYFLAAQTKQYKTKPIHHEILTEQLKETVTVLPCCEDDVERNARAGSVHLVCHSGGGGGEEKEEEAGGGWWCGGVGRV